MFSYIIPIEQGVWSTRKTGVRKEVKQMKDFVLGVLIGAVEIFFENANSSLTDILIGCLIMFFANRKGKKQALKRPYRNQPFSMRPSPYQDLYKLYHFFLLLSRMVQFIHSLFFIRLSSCKVEEDYQQKSAPLFILYFILGRIVLGGTNHVENFFTCYF